MGYMDMHRWPIKEIVYSKTPGVG